MSKVGQYFWCFDHDETYRIAGATEEEAHAEARLHINDCCMPGTTHRYRVGRVAHPVAVANSQYHRHILGERVSELVDEWAGEETGAEVNTISMSYDREVELGGLIFGYLLKHATPHWYGVEPDSETTHEWTAEVNHEIQ